MSIERITELLKSLQVTTEPVARIIAANSLEPNVHLAQIQENLSNLNSLRWLHPVETLPISSLEHATLVRLSESLEQDAFSSFGGFNDFPRRGGLWDDDITFRLRNLTTAAGIAESPLQTSYTDEEGYRPPVDIHERAMQVREREESRLRLQRELGNVITAASEALPTRPIFILPICIFPLDKDTVELQRLIQLFARKTHQTPHLMVLAVGLWLTQPESRYVPPHQYFDLEAKNETTSDGEIPGLDSDTGYPSNAKPNPEDNGPVSLFGG